MGAAWITILLYLLQITIPGTGNIVLPTPKVLYDMLPWRKNQVEVQPRFLMSVGESVEAFLFGMTRIFLALVVLVRRLHSFKSCTIIFVLHFFSQFLIEICLSFSSVLHGLPVLS